MYKVGSSISAYLTSVSRVDFTLNKITKDINTTSFILKGANFTLTISIKPSEWLSMELDVYVPTLRKISYHIDTDLYPLNQENLTYYQEVEDDILNIIRQIVNSKVKVGKINGYTTLIIPSRDAYICIQRRIFLTKQREVESIPHAKFTNLK